MAAYLIARLHITDVALFEEYRQLVPAVVAAHGGRYLVRGGARSLLEGDDLAPRVVIIEFPNMERLKAFHHSPEYQPLIEMRQRSARSSLTAIEGV